MAIWGEIIIKTNHVDSTTVKGMIDQEISTPTLYFHISALKESELFSWASLADIFFISSRVLLYQRGADIKGLEINIQLFLRHTFRDHFFKVFPAHG
jgi:hypothetical protein